MHESMVRLGTWMPFRQAVRELGFHRGITVDAETVRRNTERAGKRYMPEQERMPVSTPVPGSHRQAMSMDGAYVQLTTGEWTEVKTLTLSEVTPEGQCQHASYFSRNADYATFSRQARGEVARRGIKHAEQVCAVADGADWIQSVVDDHRPDAVRILDFYHAAERLATLAHTVFDPDSEAFNRWFTQQCHELREGDPDQVLEAVYQLTLSHPQHAQRLNEHLDYFAKRRSQMDYRHFKQSGWPIGSGSGEAAHKVVVQSRMKQAGMRWAAHNVNPMLALRNLACNDRWDEGWLQLTRAARKGRQPAPASTPNTSHSPPTGKLLPAHVVFKPLPRWRYDNRISTKS